MNAPARRQHALRDFFTLTAGAGFGPALALAASPILTRLFSPAELGVFAVFIALLGVEVVVCLGYERAVMLPREAQTRFDVLLVAIGASCVCSLLAAAVLAAFGSRIEALAGPVDLGAARYLLPVALLASGCLQALTGWCVGSRQLGRIAGSRFVQALATTGTQISWGAAGGGAVGLAAGHCIGLAAGAATIARTVPSTSDSEKVHATLAGALDALRRYRHFLISSGGALLNAATTQLPTLVLAHRFGIVTAGLLALAQRVATGPVNLLVTATSQVFASRVVEPIRAGDRHAVLRMFGKVILVQTAIAVPALLLLAVMPAVFAFVFGARWREAGVILQFLGPALAAQFMFSPVYGVLNMLERQGIHLLVEVARLALLAGALVETAHRGASLHETLVYLAAALGVGYLVAAIAAYLAIRRMPAGLVGAP